MNSASKVLGRVGRLPVSAAGRPLRAVADRLATPLLPDDYLRLVNPLWSASQLRGRVEEVRPETSDAVTLVIRPGRGWPGHRPGQHLGIGVDIDGVHHWRTYSLSSPPGSAGGCVTITVKAQPGGLVSSWLVRDIRPGTIVRLGPPEGDFVLPGTPRADGPGLLFWTAGSGITPVMAMLRHLYGGRGGPGSDRPDVVVLHSAPTPEDMIFGPELRELAARHPRLALHEQHTRTAGRLTPADLGRRCPDWRQRRTWACGPAAFLETVEAHWARAGVADRLHVERFRLPLPTVGGLGGQARFTASDVEARADGGTPLLEVGEASGVLIPSGCRMGICHRCLAPLAAGRVRDLRTGAEHGEPGELIQTCVSAAAGDVEIDL